MECNLRLCVAILIGAVSWSHAHAADAILAKALAPYQVNGQVDWDRVKRAAAKESLAARVPLVAPASAPAASPSANSPPAPQPGSDAAKGAPKNNCKQGVIFLLRQNFSDLHLFECPTQAAEAKGASFSWTDDGVADDRAWSVNGMVAAAYSVGGDTASQPGETKLMGFSLAPYAQLNRETHSKLTKKNSDVQTLGGSLEVGFDTWTPGNHFQNYLRFSASSVEDQVQNNEYFHAIGEWLPVYAFTDQLCIGVVCGAVPASQLGSMQLLYRFSPELKVLYDRALDNSAPIFFSKESESVRIGPEVTLTTKLFGPGTVLWPDYIDLSKFLFKTTYYWSIEANSGRDFSWFDSSLTYNLGDGHLGLTLSYQNGYVEETGQETELTKLSLTGKF
jgi:hypothetical protein